MPGMLSNSESSPQSAFGVKMGDEIRWGSSNGEATRKCGNQGYQNGVVLTNGNYDDTDGDYVNGISTNITRVSRRDSNAIENIVGQLPPEIEHITFGYMPFHLLVSRLVQETFNGLTEVINELAEMPAPSLSQSSLTNHLNQFADRNRFDTSGGNVQKKLRMLNFTSDRRAQFIKVLVLLRWANHADAISRVIDLNVWTNRRLQEYKDCISWMGELKRLLGPLKNPDPDIKTALAVLALGKASWLPDLGFLLAETLSSQQLLSTFRRINTLLAIRLHLHEVVPPALRDFSIASGRATFRVREEFEVDLSIAEEDHSSQLYFIDFRLDFAPAPTQIHAGRLRDEIEGKANEVLKREGLEALYSFLHNFTLTHKLSILRNQAHEMARSYWSEQLKVEALHRSVVVQYWLDRPGGKNWIELGLRRGRVAASPYALKRKAAPYIGLRWFCSGKEITDDRVEIRPGNLSLEYILNQVIAQHTSFIFERMTAKLKESTIYADSSLRLKCNVSSMTPTDVSLLVQLTTSKAIKLLQEPVSGRFSVLPASTWNNRAEFELNRVVSPGSDGASQLTHLRSFACQEEADMGARTMGWEPIRSISPNQETMQRLFGNSVQNKKFFSRPSWNLSWMLAFTTSLEGDHWWIVELVDRRTVADSAITNSAPGPTLQSAYKVVLPGVKYHTTGCSSDILADVENTAAVMISQLADTRALVLHDHPHRMQMRRRKNGRIQPGSLLMRISNQVASLPKNPTNLNLPWLDEIVRIEYHGLDASRKFAIHVAIVQMQQTALDLPGLIAEIPSVNLESASEGAPEAIKFQLAARIGESVIPSVKARLKAIELLLDFVSTLKSYNLACNAASLTRLIFNYTTHSRPLRVAVHFPRAAPRRISLSRLNPHLRIVDYLTDQIRNNRLSSVLGNLRLTLPLLCTFSVIEAGQQSAGVDILTRSDQWYQVRYSEPFSKSGFDVRMRLRRDDAMWFVPDSSIKKPEGFAEAFEENLQAVVRGKGEGWWGVNGGVVANVKGVEGLIVGLDAVFRSSKHNAEDSNSRKRKAEEEVVVVD